MALVEIEQCRIRRVFPLGFKVRSYHHLAFLRVGESQTRSYCLLQVQSNVTIRWIMITFDVGAFPFLKEPLFVLCPPKSLRTLLGVRASSSARFLFLYPVLPVLASSSATML